MLTEREQLDAMSNTELVAYWNTMQAPGLKIDPDGKDERHIPIVNALLTERNIPHEKGKRTTLSKDVNDGSLDHLIYDDRSPRP